MFRVLQKDFILKALTGSCEVSLCNFRGGNFVQCVSGAVIELCACFSELTGQRRGRCCCGSCCRSSVRKHTRRLTHTQCVTRADCIRPLCVVTVVPTCGAGLTVTAELIILISACLRSASVRVCVWFTAGIKVLCIKTESLSHNIKSPVYHRKHFNVSQMVFVHNNATAQSSMFKFTD